MDEIQRTRETNLKETLGRLNDFLDKEVPAKDKSKPWNLPWNAKSISKKKLRDGYVVFLNIKENGWGNFVKAPIEEGIAVIDNTPHKINPSDVIMLRKGLGLVIQPEWSIPPFSPAKHKAEMKPEDSTIGWKYIINYMYNTQIKAKKDIAIGLYIIIGLAVLAGGYYLIQSGAFK